MCIYIYTYCTYECCIRMWCAYSIFTNVCICVYIYTYASICMILCDHLWRVLNPSRHQGAACHCTILPKLLSCDDVAAPSTATSVSFPSSALVRSSWEPATGRPSIWANVIGWDYPSPHNCKLASQCNSTFFVNDELHTYFWWCDKPHKPKNWDGWNPSLFVFKLGTIDHWMYCQWPALACAFLQSSSLQLSPQPALFAAEALVTLTRKESQRPAQEPCHCLGVGRICCKPVVCPLKYISTICLNICPMVTLQSGKPILGCRPSHDETSSLLEECGLSCARVLPCFKQPSRAWESH